MNGYPDRIATGLGASFSVGLRYRPHHTTADRSYTVTSQNDSFQGPWTGAPIRAYGAFQAPNAVGGHRPSQPPAVAIPDSLTVWCPDFETGVVAVDGSHG
ncbi:MAG: hypothetical protein ACLU9S_09650 [Oscillospiraceae bacterium]